MYICIYIITIQNTIYINVYMYIYINVYIYYIHLLYIYILYIYMIYIYIHSFCRLVSRSSIDLVHRSEETAGVLDRRGRWCSGRRWWAAVAALVESRGGAGGGPRQRWMRQSRRRGRRNDGGAKMNAAALETKTKTKELPDPGQLCAYIGADPLAPVCGCHRC